MKFILIGLIGLAQCFLTAVCFADPTPAASVTPAPSYVRISRAFFEKPLQAELKLISPDASKPDTKTYNSPVDWVQYPPTAPAPQQSDPMLGQVLGDFRDFVACAEMTSLGQSKLCFKVMADVSNLGVNDREMTLSGIDTIDSSAPTRYLLQKASVSPTSSPTSLALEFKAADGKAANVQLTLTQVP